MTRIIVNGALGRMGREVVRLAETAPDIEVVGMADRSGNGAVVPSLWAIGAQADVLIDFTHRSTVGAVADFAVARGLALVAATTGYSPEESALLDAAAREIALFRSYNMSLGVALLVKMARQAAAAFPGADIEIVEAHHNRKADAPSGTALLLAESVQKERPGSRLVYGRSGESRRAPEEIGVHSLRMGNVVGTHEVHISTVCQTLTLRHEAHDRALFAEGALDAACFIRGKAPGLYGMEDLLG